MFNNYFMKKALDGVLILFVFQFNVWGMEIDGVLKSLHEKLTTLKGGITEVQERTGDLGSKLNLLKLNLENLKKKLSGEEEIFSEEELKGLTEEELKKLAQEKALEYKSKKQILLKKGDDWLNNEQKQREAAESKITVEEKQTFKNEVIKAIQDYDGNAESLKAFELKYINPSQSQLDSVKDVGQEMRKEIFEKCYTALPAEVKGGEVKEEKIKSLVSDEEIKTLKDIFLDLVFFGESYLQYVKGNTRFQYFELDIFGGFSGDHQPFLNIQTNFNDKAFVSEDGKKINAFGNYASFFVSMFKGLSKSVDSSSRLLYILEFFRKKGCSDIFDIFGLIKKSSQDNFDEWQLRDIKDFSVDKMKAEAGWGGQTGVLSLSEKQKLMLSAYLFTHNYIDDGNAIYSLVVDEKWGFLKKISDFIDYLIDQQIFGLGTTETILNNFLSFIAMRAQGLFVSHLFLHNSYWEASFLQYVTGAILWYSGQRPPKYDFKKGAEICLFELLQALNGRRESDEHLDKVENMCRAYQVSNALYFSRKMSFQDKALENTAVAEAFGITITPPPGVSMQVKGVSNQDLFYLDAAKVEKIEGEEEKLAITVPGYNAIGLDFKRLILKFIASIKLEKMIQDRFEETPSAKRKKKIIGQLEVIQEQFEMADQVLLSQKEAESKVSEEEKKDLEIKKEQKFLIKKFTSQSFAEGKQSVFSFSSYLKPSVSKVLDCLLIISKIAAEVKPESSVVQQISDTKSPLNFDFLSFCEWIMSENNHDAMMKKYGDQYRLLLAYATNIVRKILRSNSTLEEFFQTIQTKKENLDRLAVFIGHLLSLEKKDICFFEHAEIQKREQNEWKRASGEKLSPLQEKGHLSWEEIKSILTVSKKTLYMFNDQNLFVYYFEVFIPVEFKKRVESDKNFYKALNEQLMNINKKQFIKAIFDNSERNKKILERVKL